MKCSIAFPGLIWPDIGDEAVYNEVTTPRLDGLIKRASLSKLDYNFSDLVYATYNDSQIDGTLATAFAKQLKVDTEYSYFLLAEPTHLRVDRDRLLICETELLKLSFKETQIIIDSINSHFNREIKLYAISQELWLIGLNVDIRDNQFYPILDIIGENIDNYLPRGTNSMWLNKIINEIQMLLFNLPENVTRKQDDLLTINSLWLWDKKVDPTIINSYSKVFTNINLVNFNNTKINELVPPYFENTLVDNSLLIFDDLYYPCRYRDFVAWEERLHQVSEHLLQSLDVRQFSQINLLIPNTSSTLILNIKPRNKKYKIWKKSLNLIDLFRKYHAL